MDKNNRSCIVTDNGQRIKKEEMETIDNIMKTTKTFKPLKNIKLFLNGTKAKIIEITLKFKTTPQNKPPRINPRFRKTAAHAAVLCASLAVGSFFVTPASDVYLNSVKIGTVANKAEFETLLNEANKAITDLAGEYSRLHYIPEYIFTISPKSKLTSSDDLKRNIISLSDEVAEGYTLVADGASVMTFENEDKLNETLNSIKSSYGGSNAEIINDLSIKREFVLKSNLNADISAVKNILKVQTIEEVSYNEEIPFDINTTENENMYTDQSETLRNGQNGLKSVIARITKINGEEISREILSSREVTAPVSAQITIGSKKRPCGVGTGSLITPFYGTITSRFGARGRGTHKGVDIAGKTGSDIKAADEGTVICAEMRSDYGNLIILDHKNGMQTYYAHLDSIGVNVGDTVEKGQVIGKLGNTGYSTGPHLHFEVRENGVPCDPTAYLDDIS